MRCYYPSLAMQYPNIYMVCTNYFAFSFDFGNTWNGCALAIPHINRPFLSVSDGLVHVLYMNTTLTTVQIWYTQAPDPAGGSGNASCSPIIPAPAGYSNGYSCPTGLASGCTSVTCAAGYYGVAQVVCLLNGSSFTYEGCSVCSNCTAGNTYQVSACTPFANTVCNGCSTCNGPTYQVSACTVSANTVCNGCSTCNGNMYQVSACTVSANTVCNGCSTCTGNTYQASACTVSANTVCNACSNCTGNMYQFSACTSSTNTVCQGCAACTGNTYQAAACSATANTACANCSICAGNMYQTSACSATTNTACASCSSGKVDPQTGACAENAAARLSTHQMVWAALLAAVAAA